MPNPPTTVAAAVRVPAGWGYRLSSKVEKRYPHPAGTLTAAAPVVGVPAVWGYPFFQITCTLPFGRISWIIASSWFSSVRFCKLWIHTNWPTSNAGAACGGGDGGGGGAALHSRALSKYPSRISIEASSIVSVQLLGDLNRITEPGFRHPGSNLKSDRQNRCYPKSVIYVILFNRQ